jgi:cephalosporin-C deacetylase-like acetyl esterase
MCRTSILFALLLFVATSASGQESEESLRIVRGHLAARTTPATMLHDHLLAKAEEHFAAWQRAYDERKTPEQIADYQRTLREKFVEAIGGFPERTPLNAKVTGRVERDNFTVERVLFESEPGFYVTGALFLPDPQKFPPPWPGVVVVCGHRKDGKAYDPYQRGPARLALHAIAGFIIDPVCQGERSQLLDDQGEPLDSASTVGHTLLGTGAILLGRNTARYEIWDTMRALDYLESREDIRADSLGAMGNSGGGTQTAYLMALDDRVKAAAPSCYIVGFETLLHTIGPQDAEQNIFGQIAFGMDHADYLMMRAPRPTLMCAATEDFFEIDGVWKTFRQAKRLYSRMGASENIELVEFDGPHGWSQPLREASVEFMLRHLKGELKEVNEPDIHILSPEEIQVTPEGQVLKLAGARSAFDLNVEESRRLARERAERNLGDDELREEIRALVGVKRGNDLRYADTKSQIGEPTFKSEFESIVLTWDKGIRLPGLLIVGAEGEDSASNSPPVLYLDPSGMSDAAAAEGPVPELAHEGLALDVRGIGETTPDAKAWYDTRFGKTGGAAMIAYLMGESLVGMQTGDILVATRYLSERTGSEQIDLMASGQLTVPALHAAALEPERYGQVRLTAGLVSWANVVETPLSKNQIPTLIHGALRHYDLPDLVRLAGEGVTLEGLRDAADQEVPGGKR